MKIVFVIDHSPLMNVKRDGLSFFEQSVFAIETIIHKRVQIGCFHTDKYFLYGLQQNALSK